MAIDASLKPMPRMPWYPSSFFDSTRTWPFVARAIYRELLDISWDAGCLPADPEELRKMLGVAVSDWQKAWPLVSPKFRADNDGPQRQRCAACSVPFEPVYHWHRFCPQCWHYRRVAEVCLSFNRRAEP